MDTFFEVLRKYAEFQGRARRKEYWTFTLISVLIQIIFFVLIAGFGYAEFRFAAVALEVLCVLYVLAVFLPSLAVAVRRLHDTGKSGWWILIAFVPLASIVLLVFMLLDSQPTSNQYGPVPKPMAAIPGQAYRAQA